uniref:DNA helicase n=1 Tax=Macrostomum lignano TaxID=282301 RepID=A0A1I8IHU3_9PLAT
PPPNGNGGADAGAEDSQAKAAEGGEEAVREAEEAGAKEESAATPVSTRTRGSSGGGGGTHTSPVSAPGIYDTVKCTACGKRVNPYNGTMQLHPMLSVLVCQRCYKFYRTGQFDIDHDGKENQCRWCGEGGSLICCDRCQHSFCKSCIRRNLGRSALQSVEELPDDAVWSCYMCDSAPLLELQGMMRQYSRLLHDLAAVRTNQDRAQVVSRFKSAYRMHLFLRLGKLRSLIAEQDRHSVRKAAPAGAAAATPKPAGLSLASVLPQSSASTMAAAAALQLPGTASK